MKFKIELDKIMQQRLGVAVDLMSARIKAAAEGAVAGVARATLEKAREMAYNKLNTTAQDYADALSLDEIAPGVYVLRLRADQAHLETGYPGFSMIKGLVKNAKKISKEGYKYRAIPMQQGGPGSGRLKAGTTRGDMLRDVRTLRKVFNDNGVTMGPDGKPVTGKVWSITRDDMGRWTQRMGPGVGVKGSTTGQIAVSGHLSGLTKYQYQQKLRKGGFRTRTAFLTFRTVSENPKYASKWKHPGFDGVKIFPELEKWAIEQINKRIDEALK